MGNNNYPGNCTFHCYWVCSDVCPNTNTSTEKGQNLKIANIEYYHPNSFFYLKMVEI